MAKLGSVEELARASEAAKAEIRHRHSTGTVIRVGMGTCGIAAGARETYQALLQELARQQVTAFVGGVGCMGMCAREPLVEIQQAGRARVLYGNVTPEMVPRLIEAHVLEGEPVREWVICRMSHE